MAKQYNINQSPLYKLGTFKRLAKILDCEVKSLESLLNNPENNYYTSYVKQEKIKSGVKEIIKRKIQVPKPQLNRIHRKIQKFLSKIQKPEYLYSGVKGRSNVSNAKCHIESSYMSKVDIKNYYEDTSVKSVYKCFINTFKMKPDIANVLSVLCTYNGHIPTGSSLSQNLTFFCNINLFNQVSQYCKKREIKFSLYVDDLTFSAKYKLKKELFDRVIFLFKKNSNYTIHKFKMYDCNTAKLITGVILKDNVLYVPNKLRLKMLNHDRDRERFIKKSKNSMEESIAFFQRFIGLVSCANQINPNYKIWTKELCKERLENGITAVNYRE
ncbi:reverse transcriptase family protein [Aliiglaciecola sp. 3_MG-2023]|uniref:reverse transcriptase family protein n=1 Tax=Aliiglaciecola sp. 3_MG-2023 TaxID=3062644 RepID=UPI0026E2831E|nr:reverse transcriptase family protein [Aliiglaciecola sp. 3_MG-2023]MDO6693562.1 reverse transcriptase family protein [Aliiglaciecola sp. 3_MG-2023]